MHTGKFDVAAAEIMKCLLTRPEFETSGFNNKFGKTYLDLAKDLEIASLSLIELYQSKNSLDISEYQFPLALACHIQGRFNEARDIYLLCLTDCVTMYPHVALIMNLLASLEEQVGNLGEIKKWIDIDTYPLVFDPMETVSGMSVAEFNQSLYEEILDSNNYKFWGGLQDENWHIASNLIRHNPGPFVRKLEAIFLERTEKLLNQIAAISPVPGHRSFGQRPKKFRVEMFAAGLIGGGHAGPHVHSDAFMTANYYVKVPDVDETMEDNRGCIEYGKNLHHAAIGFENKRRVIRPAEGMMLAWPSYMSHATIPCGTDQPRMVVGYDIEPVV